MHIHEHERRVNQIVGLTFEIGHVQVRTPQIECEAWTGESGRKTPQICLIDIDPGHVCGDGRVHVLQAVSVRTSYDKHGRWSRYPQGVRLEPGQEVLTKSNDYFATHEALRRHQPVAASAARSIFMSMGRTFRRKSWFIG